MRTSSHPNTRPAVAALGLLLLASGLGTSDADQRRRQPGRTRTGRFELVPEALLHAAVGARIVDFGTRIGGSYLDPPVVRGDVFSNESTVIEAEMAIEGSIVCLRTLSVRDRSRVLGSVFSHAIEVHPAARIEGSARTLAVLERQPDPAGADVIDRYGHGYDWSSDREAPGVVAADGVITGQLDSRVVGDGDELRSRLHDRSGRALRSPDLNVLQPIAAPLIDFAALREEAERGVDTVFETRDELFTYLLGVAEWVDVGGVEALVARVGTAEEPELMYVREDVALSLVGSAGLTDFGTGDLALDGLWIEGGIVAIGDLAVFTQPTPALPPDFEAFRVVALPHCLPAVVVSQEPDASIPPDEWTPADAPEPCWPTREACRNRFELLPIGETQMGRARLEGFVYAQELAHFHALDIDEPAEPRLMQLRGSVFGLNVLIENSSEVRWDPRVACTRHVIDHRDLPFDEHRGRR